MSKQQILERIQECKEWKRNYALSARNIMDDFFHAPDNYMYKCSSFSHAVNFCVLHLARAIHCRNAERLWKFELNKL